MPQMTVNRATIDYHVLGPDDSPHPPVVFVHGVLADHRLWLKAAKPLADKGFRCILPDLPLGAHRVPVDDDVLRTPSSIAELIGDFIAALDLQNVTLVGNDTGGGLCQLLIDERPELIGRLVLTNCDAFEKFPPFPFNALFVVLRRPRVLKAALWALRVPALRHSPVGFGLLLRRNDELTASWIAPASSDTRIAQNVATLVTGIGASASALTDVATRLPRFAKPVTLVWGMADRCFTPALGRRLAATFPNATFVEVPGARTFVPLDEPEPVVAAIESVGVRAS